MILLHVFYIAFDVCSVDLQFCFVGLVLVCPLSKFFPSSSFGVSEHCVSIVAITGYLDL